MFDNLGLLLYKISPLSSSDAVVAQVLDELGLGLTDQVLEKYPSFLYLVYYKV